MATQLMAVEIPAELIERFRASLDGVKRAGQPYLTKRRVLEPLVDAWCTKWSSNDQGTLPNHPTSTADRISKDVPTRFFPLVLTPTAAERLRSTVANLGGTVTIKGVVARLIEAWCVAAETDYNGGQPWPLLGDPLSPGQRFGGQHPETR
jgi:hypothetical protein